MNYVLKSISVVNHAVVHGYPAEVCAWAEAEYDTDHRELTVTLDSFVRGVDLCLPQHRERTAWLPEPKIVHEHVPPEDASEFSDNVARCWRRRVRESVPQE